jgi:hypothetical protein
MPFSQATIESVSPPSFENNLMTVEWTSSSPPGTWYQVYINLALVWDGQELSATVAVPSGAVNSCDVGTVLPGEQTTNFASSIGGLNLFVVLEWLGGSFESPNISGFNVYQSTIPGGAINFTTPVATITAYPQGIVTDGYGYGGYGQGGYGQAAGLYSWTSTALTTGLWSFGVKAFDSAGNLSTAQTCSVPIVAPPLEPSPFPDNTRLHYTFNGVLEEVTLIWNPSPSA